MDAFRKSEHRVNCPRCLKWNLQLRRTRTPKLTYLFTRQGLILGNNVKANVTKNRYDLSQIIDCVLSFRRHAKFNTPENLCIFYNLINFNAEFEYCTAWL